MPGSSVKRRLPPNSTTVRSRQRTEHGFIQDEAVANELAARFEIERRPNSRVGAMFLRDARYAYRLWGAQRKVEELEQQYPEILRGVLDQHGSGGTVTSWGTHCLAAYPAAYRGGHAAGPEYPDQGGSGDL